MAALQLFAPFEQTPPVTRPARQLPPPGLLVFGWVDDSQKLLPWRGIAVFSGAQQTSGYSKINTLPQRPSAFSPFVAASLFNGPSNLPRAQN
jgi:hypothetical protein